MSLRAIFYDTETTGVRAEKDRVIEIAAFEPSTGRTFEKLINPGSPIPAEATAIHHISDEMVKDSPSFGEIAQEFIEFCGTDVVLIAHNNDAFDIHFLRNEFARADLTIPTEWKFLDSLKWARRYRPDLPRHALQVLREVYGFVSNNAHRALDDVIILQQVFHAMSDDLSIDQCYNLLNSQKEKELMHMPFGKHQGKPFKLIPKDYAEWLEGAGTFEKPENKQLRECFVKAGLLS